MQKKQLTKEQLRELEISMYSLKLCALAAAIFAIAIWIYADWGRISKALEPEHELEIICEDYIERYLKENTL